MSTSTNNEGIPANLLSQPILVPLDGTDVAKGILPYVSQVAKKADTSLVLLTIVDPDDIEYPTGSTGGREPVHKYQIEESVRRQASGQLNAILDDLRADGLQARAITATGSPAEEIIQAATAEGCGLIAMSTRGRNAIGRGILGSVTDKVLHSSGVPVMTFTPPSDGESPEEDDTTLSTVVVPLDGSVLAETALPYAEELSRVLSLDIAIARVVKTGSPFTYPELAATLPDPTEEMLREARDYLSEVAEELRARGASVSTQVLRGAPASALLEFAQSTPQDIIVMTTHGRSGLSRWVLGSVAEALVRGSGDPVLVVQG